MPRPKEQGNEGNPAATRSEARSNPGSTNVTPKARGTPRKKRHAAIADATTASKQAPSTASARTKTRNAEL